jgi:lysophospholipase L1-like esterase
MLAPPATRVRLVLVSLLVSVFALASAPLGAAPASASSSLPRVMASTGDSITRAFDVGWCCVLQDSPSRSWSTGWNTDVYSHYRRLLTAAPQLAGHNYNDARSGAKMSDLPGQLSAAANQHADYVTILMGANDLCTSSISTMTPTTIFEAQFRTALGSFTAAQPAARVFVSSIPNIYRLWSLLHGNWLAAATWKTFNICQSMLSTSNTEEQRQQVAAQEVADNAALQRVCAQFPQCRWDGYATYNTTFSTADVSTVDYYHPSVTGQNHLAAVTWAAGYWPSIG